MFNKDKISKTDFLLPKNNFLVGFGSVLNIAGSYFEYNSSKTGNEADLKALFSDWLNVGEDLNVSKKKFEKKYKKELTSK
ncbi:hypothetical protein [Wenyingzhuangia sp. 2_MG-2023]|uniref:hypothetical protein n=1 Tax=Wenyingzhuangia sp. 2_MG-2023 TaxID=3062639 RepID=UPI0026E2F7E5|nr:hypothetical protein [Wenyingzhuangia sp. 2_MG-2023]MDO6738311.1 hypothetical protein [Wenyingzhuangia sp. 2_MG-2023]MDO6802205.1 hypothetical protein [Wenyingzhuangia sp. 1_MG-2023]